MNALLLFGVFVLGLVIGYAILWRTHQTGYLASAEYWVYLPEAEMPEQNLLLERIVGRNPYSKRGFTPIGTEEGLILSDVRLHIAHVLRSKNPHVFRPDLFEDIDIDADQI